MRMFAGFGSAEDTNERFHQLLNAGQTGLSIAYDMPTLYGYDTDDAEAEGEFGTCGVAVSSLADMEVLLDGLPLDRISTSMTINSPAARSGRCTSPPPRSAASRARSLRHDPERHPQGVRGPEGVPVPARAIHPPRHGHDRIRDARAAQVEHHLHLRLPHPRSGSTAVQELAFTIADGMAYVEEAIKRGLRVDEFAPRLSSSSTRTTTLRGDRQVPRGAANLVEANDPRYRAENERSDLDAFPYATAGVSLTAQQPLNNLTRVAIQALAACSAARNRSTPTRMTSLGRALRGRRAARSSSAAGHRRRDRRGQHGRPARWLMVRRVADQRRPSARCGVNWTRSTRWGGRSRPFRRFPQKEIAELGLPVPARVRCRRARDRRRKRLRRRAEELSIPLLEVSEESKQRHLSRLARTRAERDPERVACEHSHTSRAICAARLLGGERDAVR